MPGEHSELSGVDACDRLRLQARLLRTVARNGCAVPPLPGRSRVQRWCQSARGQTRLFTG